MQDPNRTQTFTYNPPNRILQASTNGPAWGEAFTIDAWGNMWQRGSVTGKTSYSYDVLNRLTQKSYNDGTTAPVQYGYDVTNPLPNCYQSLPNPPPDSYPVGRLTQMCVGSASPSVPGPELTYYTHDQMGRATLVRHKIAPSTDGYGFIYKYNLDGSVISEYYGLTGHTHAFTYNGAGRPTSLVDWAGHTNVLSATYTPFGAGCPTHSRFLRMSG